MTQEQIFEIRRRMLKCRSADFYDTMDIMGYPNQCMDTRIKPLCDKMKVAGPAFTMWGMREPLFGEDLPRPEFDGFVMFDRIYPGCVLVMNAEKDDAVGHWGEMMSYGARNKGATGAVIDGNTRDKEGILDIENWSCFARNVTPVESKKRWRPKALEIPIIVSGTLSAHITVNPGDWIFGDCDGVMVIPKEILLETLEKTEDLTERENLSRKALAEGMLLPDVVKKYGRA